MSKKEKYEINYSGMVSKDTLEYFIRNKDIRIRVGEKYLDFNELCTKNQIDETSIDLNIGELYKHSKKTYILDIKSRYDDKEYYVKVIANKSSEIILNPGEFLLGRTYEAITTPPFFSGLLMERRTTIGNFGIIIKGFIPPGLKSENLRFTISHTGVLPVKIYIGEVPPIKSIFFFLSSEQEYGKEREVRVKKGQAYSSGAGSIEPPNYGGISVNYKIEKNIFYVGEKVDVDVTIENISLIPININEIFPSNIDSEDYNIISCSKNFSMLEEKEEHLEKKGNLFEKLFKFFKRGKKVKSIKTTSPTLDCDSKINGSFKIMFLRPNENGNIKLEFKCTTGEGLNVIIKSNEEALLAFNHIKVLKKTLLKKILSIFIGNILTIFIIAIVIAIYKKILPITFIKDFFVSLLKEVGVILSKMFGLDG